MNFPNDPSGTSREASWLRRLLHACRSDRILPGVRYKVRRTTVGTMLEIDFGAGGGSRVSRYRFKSMSTDHLVCHSWDGLVEGTVGVNIAKSSKLRYSISAEIIDGIAITYAYASQTGQIRTATGSGISESQVIVPRFLVDDEIYAIPASTGVTLGTIESPEKLTLLDLNVDGRAWSAT